MPRVLPNIYRRMLASCLGVLLLVMLLMLVSLNSEYKVTPPRTIVTREVRTLSPPPPPPPPPVKQQGSAGSPMPSLTRARVQNSVKLDAMDLETDISGIEAGGIGGFGLGGTGTGNGLGSGSGDWEIVGLPELDNTPMVRSAPFIPYPKEAVDRGIQEFRVEVHIVIDEEGRTYPIRILKNPFPSMNKGIMEFVSSVIFTPPTKLGAPVKTEYLWPLVIKNPSPKKR